MNATKRSLISSTIALIVCAIIYVTMPNYYLAPQGIVLPTQGNYQPYQGQVQLYTAWSRPADALTIGKITVEYHSKVNNQQAALRAITKAKQLAAKAGGNGLVYSIEYSTASTPKGLAKLFIIGTVIRTHSEDKQ